MWVTATLLASAGFALAADPPLACHLDRDPAIVRAGNDFELAKRLQFRGLAASAALFYVRASCESLDDPRRLAPALDLAEQWGARDDLQSMAQGLGPARFPPEASSLLSYVEGRRLLDAGENAEAYSVLTEISEASHLYARGQILASLAQLRRGKLKLGVKALADAHHHSDDPSIRAAVSLGIGRVYYGIANYDVAARYIEGASPGPERDEALAWARLLAAQGRSGKLTADLDHVAAPAVGLVAALGLFMPAELAAALGVAETAERQWRPVLVAIDDARRVGDWATGLERLARGEAIAGSSSAAYLARWTGGTELRELLARRSRLLAERGMEARVGMADRPAWRSELDAALVRVDRRGAELLARALERASGHLRWVLEQVEVTRMETLDSMDDPRGLQAMERVQAWDHSGELAVRIAIARGGDVIAGLRSAVEAFPDSSAARHEFALWLWEAGKREEAAFHLRQVREGALHHHARALLGQYHFDRGDFVAARRDFTQAEEPYMVAWCEWGLGEREVALATMRTSTDARAVEDAARMERALGAR